MKSSGYYNHFRKDVYDLVKHEKASKILEIGGGRFELLKKLKNDFDARCMGVDIESSQSDEISLINGSIEDSNVMEKLKSEKFDLVLANDVLEHLVKPEKTIRDIHFLLEDHGRVAISVPNVRQVRTFFNIYLRGTFPRVEEGLFDSTHLRWFCKKDIVNLIEESGFKILKLQIEGRFLPRILNNTIIGELIGRQILIVARKV